MSLDRAFVASLRVGTGLSFSGLLASSAVRSLVEASDALLLCLVEVYLPLQIPKLSFSRQVSTS